MYQEVYSHFAGGNNYFHFMLFLYRKSLSETFFLSELFYCQPIFKTFALLLWKMTMPTEYASCHGNTYLFYFPSPVHVHENVDWSQCIEI